MEELVRVFRGTEHYHNWVLVNCARCKREEHYSFECPMTIAVLKSLYFDGLLPRSVAERIGFFDMDETLKSKACALWRCREFEAIQGNLQ